MDILPIELYLEISKYLVGMECEVLALYTANYYIKTINNEKKPTFNKSLNLLTMYDIYTTYKNYTLHSYDGAPAEIFNNKFRSWYIYGKLYDYHIYHRSY
jgi:hypothetical protein